jgi:hypothetical protein
MTAEEFCKQFRKNNPIANAESIEHWIGEHCIEFAKFHLNNFSKQFDLSIWTKDDIIESYIEKHLK